MRLSLEALQDMGDSQITLLHSCLALPKVSFVLRTFPLSHICDTVQEFDQSIRNALEAILGGPMSDWSWLKASLPSSRGGLNLTVPICTLQPSTSPPVQAQSSWWRVYWGSPLLPLLMSAPLWLILLLLRPSQNGPTRIMLMSPYVNVSFHMLLMRLSTSAFTPLPLPTMPEL